MLKFYKKKTRTKAINLKEPIENMCENGKTIIKNIINKS